MIQICRNDREKVYEAIRTGKIDAAEMSFPNLIDDIILTMNRRGLTDLLTYALTRINRKSFFAFPPRFKYNKENIGGCVHVTYG